MLLLLAFALIAGAGTALSPCALPVLPAVLSAGAAGGRRRPLGVVLGLSVTFCVTIIGLAELADGVGVGDTALRTVAIVALLIFGIAVAVPAVGDRLEAPLSRLARLGPRTRGDGFVSGLGVGAALGFVYAPCAGPILAAVVSVSAVSGRIVAIALAYTLGAAVVLLALSLGGRRLAGRVRAAGRGPALQTALGAVMVITAVAMLARLDIRLQTALAQHLGRGGVVGFLADPAGGIERSGAVSKRLAELRGRPRFARRSGLPVLGVAPDFTGTQRWFNSRPLTITGLRGRVVLVDFWTYTCVNCIRTQPYLKAWDARYRDRGLTIVGIHSPEFGFEKDAGNVERAVGAAGLRYPVVQDNDLATWKAWGNQYWPAEYLVDADGHVRGAHFGEGDYAKTERDIRALLAEAGARRLGARAQPHGAVAPSAQTTPETYLGTLRAERVDRGVAPRRLALGHFSLRGPWRVGLEQATAGRGARLDARVHARNVYLVLSSSGRRPRRVRVAVDGRAHRTVTVREQRLYTLVTLPRAGNHLVDLRLDGGLSAYAFTFG